MDTNAKRILLVEDNSDDEELIMFTFKKYEMSDIVHIARDGAEALEYLFGSINSNELRDLPPDLVLLDLKLPKIDGLEVLKRIKTHPDAKKISVVVFTSSQEEKDMVEASRFKVDGYIVKPMDFKDFPKSLEEIGLVWLLHSR
jgi:CheY-like chemotaxis protein